MPDDHSHQSVNPVDAQVKAYNAHDLDGFLACYSRDIVIRDREPLRGVMVYHQTGGVIDRAAWLT